MKIGVIGTGAMGSIYAAVLGGAGHEVWAFDNRWDHIEAIRRGGLRLDGASGDHRVHVQGTTDAAEAGTCELAVIATKTFDTETALRDAAPMLGPETLLLPIQNGLGNGERVAALLGQDNLLVGIAAAFGSSVVGPGHVHPEALGTIHFAEFRGGITPRLRNVAGVWQDAGFRVELFEDPLRMVWGKLIGNVAFAAPCAVTDLTIGEVMDNPWAWSLALACVRETAAVAAAKGIQLPYQDPEAWVTRFGSMIRGARPSLALDLRAGRRCEIDSLHGAVAREGEVVGVPTPTCRVLSAIVKALEHKGYAG